MQKKKSKNSASKPCDCLACRLQNAIISELAPEDADGFTIDAIEALDALGPTISMFLAGVEYRDAEAYWREILNGRARLMTPDGVDYGDNFKGRA